MVASDVWRTTTEEFSPIDKSKFNDVAFRLLDHLNKHHSKDAEILNVVMVARVQDQGDEYIDLVLSTDTTKDEAKYMLKFAHDNVRADPSQE